MGAAAMSEDDQNIDPQKLAQYDLLAPGWVIRCKRCGHTEPFGKHGIRLGAVSAGKRVFARCPRCHRFGCHVVQQRQPPRGVSASQ
jgi:hypothetical protein